MEKVVGNGDQRENVENGKECDRMREKCYKTRRENIEIFRYFARSCTRVGVHYHPLCSRCLLMI